LLDCKIDISNRDESRS